MRLGVAQAREVLEGGSREVGGRCQQRGANDRQSGEPRGSHEKERVRIEKSERLEQKGGREGEATVGIGEEKKKKKGGGVLRV